MVGIALKNELVVCQEKITNTSQVDWTEEDYDTLRHETFNTLFKTVWMVS